MHGSETETPRGDWAPKRTILLDVDGVIADFCGSALEVIKQLGHGEFLPDHVVEFAMELLVPEHARPSFLERLQADGFCSALAPYDGAQDFVRELRSLGEVVVVTAPMPGSTSWRVERESWLQRHFGLTYVVSTHEKHTVRGDFLIEDKWENAVGWAEAHPMGRVLLLDRPYNRGRSHDGVWRVRDYAQAVWALRHDADTSRFVTGLLRQATRE
jgi:5'(3')-deoxyribonucleotidase